MSANTLSLPIDIPWKRLCVSEDMIDRTVCDRKFPYRWRSSIAVFSYQPPDDQQSYEGMTVSYLKVACTITSFQPNPEEVGLKDRRVDSYWNTPLIIEDYVNKVSKAYPCYGSILEVGVAPSEKTIDGEEIPLNKYPYFMDFEPKKRELYELVSETGEKMSRSLDEVNIKKGLTTTSSKEVLDETQVGVTAKAGGGIGPIGVSVEGSFSNKSATKNISGNEVQDIRTTDTAREQRENNSHTTQLTQMYQQLNSYHLGTNRAVFFMLPRPHIIDDKNTPLTFINGPRRLEGIQEFFLVVMRPKEVKDICVEAYLETAHIGEIPTYGDKFKTDTDTTQTLSLYKEATRPNLKASGSITYSVRPGWEIDISNNGGYKINILKEEGKQFCGVTEIDQKHLVLKGEVATAIKEEWDPGIEKDDDGKTKGPVNKPTKTKEPIDGVLEANATVYLRQGERTQTGSASGLYITGRGCCCCQTVDDRNKRLLSESVVWEQFMPLALTATVGDFARMSVVDANRVRAEIDRMMVKSMNHPDRYEAGTINFAETQLVAQSIGSIISTGGHPDDHVLGEIRGLGEIVGKKIALRSPNILRSDLLLMSPAEQRDRFSLTSDEVTHLRRAILGLESPPPAPQHRWDLPGQTRTESSIPDVVGLSLSEATEMLRADKFVVGEVTYQDSELPSNTVLVQDPCANSVALTQTKIDLTLATGLTVRIPDVVCKTLSQALVMLRDAGLKSEPELCFVSNEEYPRGQVIAVSPGMRSYITPNSNVTLQVANCSNDCIENTSS